MEVQKNRTKQLLPASRLNPPNSPSEPRMIHLKRKLTRSRAQLQIRPRMRVLTGKSLGGRSRSAVVRMQFRGWSNAR
jgi:hypothetical protein